MSLNNSGANKNLITKKVEAVNKVNSEGVKEIGYPNNKDLTRGKKGGIVGKE